MNFDRPQSAENVGSHEVAGLTGKACRDPSVEHADPADGSALGLTLRALRPLLSDDVTDVCINSPREVFIETSSGWRGESLPFADFAWCHRLAKLVAHATRQRVDETSPLLSAWLPSGERIQIVLPPATGSECVAIAIRRPSQQSWSLEQLALRGIFARAQVATTEIDQTERELLGLLQSQRYEEFVRKAVIARKNIIVAGPTSSGKTTYIKALVREIPADERLIAIEDAFELQFDAHPNHVRLRYSKGDQGLAKVTPTQLLEASLRLRPDRILLAELRGGEAYDFLRSVNSGHPAITSLHAPTAELAFEQMVLMTKQSPGAQDLSRADIKQLLYLLVDVVIQFGLERQRRYIKEIWFDPNRKRRAFAANAWS